MSHLQKDGAGPAGGRAWRDVAAARARILMVDHDATALRGLESRLRADGFSTVIVADAAAAIREVMRARPDVVLTDLHGAAVDGVDLCLRIHEIDDELPVVIMTASSDVPAVLRSLRAGAEDFLSKPLDHDTVVDCIDRAISRHAARYEHERLQLQNEELFRTVNERLVISSVREHDQAETESYERAQLNALLTNLSEGVVVADATHHIRVVNDAAREILGIGASTPTTVDALNVSAAYDLEGGPLSVAEQPIMRALRGDSFVDYEVLCSLPSGERRHVVSTGTAVRDQDGWVTLAIVVFRDVTELRRLERQRDEYLALITHDLRSPLASILLFLGTVQTSLETAGMTESVRIIDRAKRNLDRMTAMLSDLSEATTLEAKRVTLQCVPCDVRTIVADVMDSLDEGRRRRIAFECGEGPYVVFADSSRLERVVTNLVTNALKYSGENASVTIRLDRRGDEVQIDVRDEGIGIAADSIAMLFEPYYRTSGGRARAGGLGLGLYITRLIVEAHRGRIEVSSRVGKGSTFSVFLPRHTEDHP